MKDLIARFLEHVRDEGWGPMIEVSIEGDIFDGLVVGELTEIIYEMREALAADEEDLQ